MNNIEIKLYCNSGKIDKMALSLLLKSNIPFKIMGPDSNNDIPYIKYGHWIFSDLSGIKRFTEQWTQNQLPPYDALSKRKINNSFIQK